MLKAKRLHSDRYFDIFAIEDNDNCFVENFINGLQLSYRKKIVRLLKYAAKNGLPKNKEKFKKLHCKEMDIYEFKCKPYRILCTLVGKRKIILSHGLTKCNPLRLEREITKAVELFERYLYGEAK